MIAFFLTLSLTHSRTESKEKPTDMWAHRQTADVGCLRRQIRTAGLEDAIGSITVPSFIKNTQNTGDPATPKRSAKLR